MDPFTLDDILLSPDSTSAALKASNPLPYSIPQQVKSRNTGNSSNTKTYKAGQRRSKANARERHRMHGLNAALDNLRRCIPLVSTNQKLSKIETLRLARNYISLLSSMLENPSETNHPTQIACHLSRGLSQATANTLTSLMGLHNRSLTSLNIDHGQLQISNKSRSQNAFQMNDILTLFSNPTIEHMYNNDTFQDGGGLQFNLGVSLWNPGLNETLQPFNFNDLIEQSLTNV